jgi:DNA-binding ferritin-like protein (Dps family)
VFIALVSIACYIWNSVKTPANEFIDWAKPQLEQFENENFDDDRFENLLQSEINTLVNEKSEDEWKSIFEDSTGSNVIEKGSYLFFSILQQ